MAQRSFLSPYLSWTSHSSTRSALFPCVWRISPRPFGIAELEKGFFPHFFNRAENQNYAGSLSDAMYHDPNGMRARDREKFYAWYNDFKSQEFVFDFQADVDILRRCCLEFRELFHQVTNVDPFAQCLTIAFACNLVFPKTFLKKNTISIIPPHGYKPENKESIIALKMLTYIAIRDDIAIRHTRNHGEQRIDKYLVDGYNSETRVSMARMSKVLCSRYDQPRQSPHHERTSPRNSGKYTVP